MRKVTVTTMAACACLAVFSLTPGLAAPQPNLDSVVVYPNPFQPGAGHTAVTFSELTNDVRIRVYTLTGRLVWEADTDASGGALLWNGTNDGGSPVASGLYFYLVTGPDGQKAQGRIAVLR